MQNDWGLHESYSCLESQFVTPPVNTGETYFIMFLYNFFRRNYYFNKLSDIYQKKEKKKTNCRILFPKKKINCRIQNNFFFKSAG